MRKSLLAVAGLTLMAGVPAIAQEATTPSSTAGADEYFEAGAGLFMRPRYPGAGSVRIAPRPTFGGIADLDPSDRLAGGVREGLRYNLVSPPERVGFGPAVRLDFGRTRRDADRYTPGLGKVGLGLELGGFAQVALVPDTYARVEARQAVTGHEGLIADATLERVWRFSERGALLTGVRARYTDARYNRAYFGVTPAQSLASGGGASPPLPPAAASARRVPERHSISPSPNAGAARLRATTRG